MTGWFSFAVCGFAAALLAPTARASGDATQQPPRAQVERGKTTTQGKEKIPAQHKDPEEPASASAGASAAPDSGGTDLGVKADKEDEEFRKKEGKRGN